MKKTLQIVKTVAVWLVVAVAIFMMIFTVVSVTTFDKADRDVFGYKMLIALSDSMKKTDFDAGDLIFVKEVEPATLKEGDIITYISTNTDNYGELITHKIRTLTTDATGKAGFVTYGTTTDTDDEIIVTYEYVVGKYTGRLPNVGHFFQFLKTTPGYIICILLPFLLLIGFQGFNSIRLFRQYRQEQMADMKAERAKIEEERAESQRMMAELLALKEQLAKQGGEQTHSADPTSEDIKSDET